MRIGFVGLGNMGWPMAASIARAGLPLVTYDLREVAVEAGLGWTRAATAAELVQATEVVCVCVTYDAQVLDLVLGDDGLLAHGRSGQTFVIHSTVKPSTVVALHGACQARGIDVVDACVTGGDQAAHRGELTLIVGGTPEVVERLQPLFDAVGSKTHHVGPVGSGAAAKLTNNLLTLGNFVLMSEALRVAAEFGVSERNAVDVVVDGTGDSWIARNWGYHDRLLREHTDAGTDAIYRRLSKDLWSVVEIARDRGFEVPVATMAAHTMPRLLRERDRRGSAAEGGAV